MPSSDVVLNFNRQKLMGIITSDLRVKEVDLGSGGKMTRCEFEVECRRYKEDASRVTIVTCVAEGKQAQEIIERREKGSVILVTGNVGGFDELGPGKAGSHKLRINRVHFDFLNEGLWAGKISSEPYFNEKAGNVSFYLTVDRHIETIVRSRIKVIAREQSALVLKEIGTASSIGMCVLVVGELELLRGEHIVFTNQIYPLLPQDKMGSIKETLTTRKKEKRNAERSANTGGRPSDAAKPAEAVQGQAATPCDLNKPTTSGDTGGGEHPAK